MRTEQQFNEKKFTKTITDLPTHAYRVRTFIIYI